jgi:hypothetical protein
MAKMMGYAHTYISIMVPPLLAKISCVESHSCKSWLTLSVKEYTIIQLLINK